MAAGNSAEQRARIGSLAERQLGLVTRAQALDAGFSKDRIHRSVTSGEWSRELPRVYGVFAVKPRWRQRALAACLSVGPGTAASHVTAGAIWNLDGVEPGRRTHVSSIKRARSPAADVVVHQTQTPFAIHHVGGIPTTAAARTLIDICAYLPHDQIELALEDGLRRGLTSLDHLRRALTAAGGKGRKGSGSLSQLVAMIDGPATESPLELATLHALRRAGLPPPVRQHVVEGSDGFRARLDLAYPAAKVGIEADGYRWHSGRRAWSLDKRGTSVLASLGWTLLPVTKADLDEGAPALVAAVRRFLGQGSLGA